MDRLKPRSFLRRSTYYWFRQEKSELSDACYITGHLLKLEVYSIHTLRAFLFDPVKLSVVLGRFALPAGRVSTSHNYHALRQSAHEMLSLNNIYEPQLCHHCDLLDPGSFVNQGRPSIQSRGPPFDCSSRCTCPWCPENSRLPEDYVQAT